MQAVRELTAGFFGTASTSEALFGCLEYLPVILALILWAIFPPSSFFKHLASAGAQGRFDGRSEDGMSERKESRRERKERRRIEKESRRSDVGAQA